MSSADPRLRRADGLPIAVFLCGLALTLAAWSAARRAIHKADQARFDRLAESVVLSLEERLRSVERGLQGIRGLFAASREVEREEFRAFAASLDREGFPGVVGFGFVRAVRAGDLDAYVRRTRALGARDFAVKPPESAPVRYVLEYVEPAAMNGSALGFDMGSGPRRRAAADLARDSGKAALTRGLTRYQDGVGNPVLILILPLYEGGAVPPTVAERRAAHLGFASAPIRIEAFLKGFAAGTEGLVDLEIRDQLEDGGRERLFRSAGFAGTAQAADGPFRRSMEARMAGRTWILDMRALPAFASGGQRVVVPAILLGGVVVSLLGAGFAGVGDRARRRAEAMARRMTRDLREGEESWKFALEGAGDGVWDILVEEGRVCYSAQGRRMLGYAEDEPFCGTLEAWQVVVHPDDRHGASEAFYRHIRGDTPYYQREMRLRCKDGSWKWIVSRGKVIRRAAGGQSTRVIGIHRDITEVRAAAQRLQETLAFQAALLRQAPYGVASTDTGGVVRVWNLALEEMVGYRADEVVGLRTPAFLHLPSELEARAAELGREYGVPVAPDAEVFIVPARLGRKVEHEWTLRRKDGTTFPALLTVTAIRDGSGNITAYQGMVQDLTARKQAEEALRLAKAEAEKADRAKSDFLAYMSHEIRTPIHGVLGLTHLLMGTRLDDVQEDYVSTIRASGEVLLTLINDILDWSKIEAGMLALEIRDFDGRAACREVLDLMRAKADAKGLRLRLEYPPEAPQALRADPGRTRQILLNLVGNAVKFTAAGEVVLRAGWRDGCACFAVTDTGDGVPPERRHLLFRRFSQADAGIAGRFGGTGLGLSISKRLVEMLGGAIGHRDGRGGGSEFWFTLPVPEAGRDAPAAAEASGEDAAPPPAAPPAARPRVLVVDDNAVNRKVAEGMLAAMDCDTQSAGSGAEALERLAADRYDLILMDCEMPGMNGFETTREIRRREEGSGRRTPVYALTANVLAGNRDRCHAAGMDGYLAKPFQMEDLRRIALRAETLSRSAIPDPAGSPA